VKFDLRKILRKHGKKYSELLGIKLKGGKESGIFKWFIASILFGARINETIAINTYKSFEKNNLLDFKNMRKASWSRLVRVLDDGGYVRYDESTATRLIDMMKLLENRYGGKITNIHAAAKDRKDLEERLQEFNGVGPTTVNIFLRDLRGIWKKADPELGKLAKSAAKQLGIKDAKEFWKKNKVRGYDFVNFETALMRLGREARRKKCKVKILV
jgi:endonuclease III